jgi:hypothetical protein
MNTVVSTFLFVILLYGCENNGKRYDVKNIFVSNRISYNKPDMLPLNGMVFCKYGDMGKYVGGKRKGIHRGWYENGQLQYEGKYVNGKRDEIHKGWHKNGQLMYEWNFNNNEIINQNCWDEEGKEMKCK